MKTPVLESLFNKVENKKEEIKQNWTRPENFDISFSVSFDH